MKKQLITAFLFVGLLIAGALSYNIYSDYKFEQKVKAVNAHIKELKNEGYSEKAARIIATTEAGMRPVDAEYNMLIED